MRFLLTLLTLATLAVPAAAQLAATVPAEDPVYDLLTQVADVMGTRGYMTGQRPLSRREVARIALAMDQDLQSRESGKSKKPVPPQRTQNIIALVLRAYDADVRELRDSAGPATNPGMPVEAMQFSALGTNSARRRVPASNGLGSIDAYTNPLMDGRWGRPIANDGATLDLETWHRLGFRDHFALGAQPRVSWLDDSTRGRYVNAGFQRLYARGVWHNAALEAGPDEYLWGLGGTRGMLLSANAPPLHSITLSTDTAVTLPWVLGLLGRTRATFLAADLGQNRNFPGAKLVGYQVSSTPADRLEMGAGILVQQGGQGSPPASLVSRTATLFPYIFWIVATGKDTIRAEHLAEAEMRYRLNESRGVVAYYELDLTDFDLRRLKSIFTQNGTHLLGLTVQRLDDEGQLSMDVQFHQTSLIQAEHYEYTSGMTYQQAIIGEPLGPNAKAGYGTLTWRPAPLSSVSLGAAYESRDPSLFNSQAYLGSSLKLVKVGQGVRENRARLMLTTTQGTLGPGFTFLPSLGVEHASNVGFISGVSRTYVVGELAGRVGF